MDITPEYFKLSRSIRQGCPISALLFLLVAEIIAIHIRQNEDVEGIKISDIEYKINLMADDTTMYIVNLTSLTNAIKCFKKFEMCSGLKLNIGKTEIIPIGKVKNSEIILPHHLLEIKVKQGPFKALGIWFSINDKEINELNFNERIINMQKLLNIWKSRNLSLKGKITIIKSLILPQVQFLFSMIYVPEHVLKKIDELLFNFLWNNKPAKIKRTTIIAEIHEGGLGMVDVYAVHIAAKCGWIKRLTNNTEAKWKKLMWYMLNLSTNIINKAFEEKLIKLCRTNFHKQIMASWYTITSNEPVSLKEVLNQYLLDNKIIKVGGRTLKSIVKGSSSTNNLKVIDIIDDNGNFLSCQQLNHKLNISMPIMKYNSIIHAIPNRWKIILKQKVPHTELENQKLTDEPHVNINNNQTPISNIKNKQIYQNVISTKVKEPTAIEKWIISYPFLEKQDWKSTYQIAFNIIKEPYLQSFQYKVLNRIINCNDILYKWKIKKSFECDYCKEIDTIEHHLFFCKASKEIWDKLQIWLKSNMNINFPLTVCEVIFGIPNSADSNIKLINFLIIITKWYLNKMKSESKQIYFITLLSIIREKLESIMYINNLNNKENENWENELRDML